MKKRASIVRQLSLHDNNEPQLQFFNKSQKLFKKQNSLEITTESSKPNRTQSAKGRIVGGEFSKPSQVKLAWTEDVISSETKPFSSNKKSLENARILFKNTRHSSIENLHPHQELQKRLEDTWKRRRNKQNIDIYLTTTPNNSEDKEVIKSPKIITPLHPETLNENVFQKKIKRANTLHQQQQQEKTKCKAVVVVPLIENHYDHTASSDDTEETLFQKSLEDQSEKSSNVISVVANSTPPIKKGPFQKKGEHFRPPLIRASSVPTKLDKPKFFAHRKRIKSAKSKEKKKNFQESDSDEIDLDFSQEKFQNTRLHKFIQFSGSEIITMVSLVSPDESDNEENLDSKKQEANNPPPPGTDSNHSEESQKSLRKTAKTVSFQQSSIHTVRSFSASFPARRRSNFDKMQEKEIENQNNFTKRRNMGQSTGMETPKSKSLIRQETIKIEPSPKNMTILEEKSEKVSNFEEDEQKKSSPIFENDKEKQCWELYTKVNQKGVSVAFDTILRGMLTPTEYRLRRRHSLAEVEAPSSENYA